MKDVVLKVYMTDSLYELFHVYLTTDSLYDVIALKPSENVKFYFHLDQKPWAGLGPGTSHAVTSKQDSRSTS